MTRAEALKRVLVEYQRAAEKHANFNGPHEGWAVIYEEVDELWDEVKLRDHDGTRMANEATQIAAMALRFLTDIC